MATKINVLQVIPTLGYGGAETGCYDIAHYLAEQNCGSFIATSGGDLLKFVKKSKVGIKTSTIDFFSKLKFIKITVGNMKMVIENKLKANKPTLFNICNISVNDEKL